MRPAKGAVSRSVVAATRVSIFSSLPLLRLPHVVRPTRPPNSYVFRDRPGASLSKSDQSAWPDLLTTGEDVKRLTFVPDVFWPYQGSGHFTNWRRSGSRCSLQPRRQAWRHDYYCMAAHAEGCVRHGPI